MAAGCLLPLLLSFFAITASAGPNDTCRYIPGDAGWPSYSDWTQLNLTVGGRLIATVPVGHVCHKSGPFAAYNQTACEDLGKAVQDAGAVTLFVLPIPEFARDRTLLLTLLPSSPIPGEIFNPYWQNETCSPFTSSNESCELGNRAIYSINVSQPADVQVGLDFATKRNLRLVIRNTGIE